MNRIYHHWETWECYKAGFYGMQPPEPLTPDQARSMYAEFLQDTPRFEKALDRVLVEWPISCEQFLSNASHNRIAWLGQSSMCIETKIPAAFCGGFNLLTDAEQAKANSVAAQWLRKWLKTRKTTPFVFGGSMDKPAAKRKEPKTMQGKIQSYIDTWTHQGYPDGIPDEVPAAIASRNLAPSYRAIAIAIMKNDLHLTTLGFTAPSSEWYGIFKRIEIAARPKPKTPQPTLWELT